LCQTRWCWICRQHFRGRKSLEQHFFFYNIFGCPGLGSSPANLLLTLLINVGYAVLFPITLLFAPMIVMIKNY